MTNANNSHNKKQQNVKYFYEAKEKLGLLSIGDPDNGGKVQVTDTYVVALARKLDQRIKSYPTLKEGLSKTRRVAKKGKQIPKKVTSRVKRVKTQNSGAIRHIDIKDIELPPIAKNPQVSIIIPVFNKFEYTKSCLSSLAKNLVNDGISFEVIVVDNASSDDTVKLSQLSNLKYTRNKENLGFVGGCNSGIALSNGKFVLFLNNDTEVSPGWLKHLYETITSDSSIGIVGSKIVYPNGTLQEAGGIIFNDGAGLNYGKFDRADSYQYNYVREVDYCSGASIILSKDLLLKIGGFDKLYEPAYYEDTDMCFKVRDMGLKVIYQPLSIVYHIEGGTAGKDLNSGFKKYQAINKEKFVTRWKKTLSTSHHDENDYYAGRDRSGDKLALIIEEAIPTPDKDSGSVRMVAMIKGLQEIGYKVTFWPNNLKNVEPYTQNLQQMGVEVVYDNVDFMQFAGHYAHYYDVVVMSRPEICAKYINICRSLFINAHLIYDTVDLHYLRLARQAEIEPANAGQLLEQSKWYEILEKGLMNRTDTTLVVSTKEVDILKEDGVKANVKVLSNIHTIVDTSYKNTFDDRSDIIFVGNYAHLPNRDAILWFLDDIFPKIRKKLPKIKLHIVGANLPKSLEEKIKRSGTVVHGFVSDEKLTELLRESRIFIAPLRYGAGVKGKIGQAIEHGIPVVSTSIGAEGMHLEDNVSCLVADTAEKFAESVVHLYDDPKEWGKIRLNARTSLMDNFSTEVAKNNLKEILHENR